MAVSLGIKHHDSGTYDAIPIAANEYFTGRWLPACLDLGLRHVSRFHDGALSALSSDELPEIIAELETLRTWAVTNDTFMAERIDGVLHALRKSASESCEHDFG